MNKKLIATAASVATALSFVLAAPVFAVQVGVNVSGTATAGTGETSVNSSMRADADIGATSTDNDKGQTGNQETAIEKGQDRGDMLAQNRVEALNRLLVRIGNMKNLSDSAKASLAVTVQASIADLTNLAAKIKADTSSTSLKADLKSIAPAYRIYMLVMPQISILSAADRVNTLVTSFQTIESKIQARIAADATLSGNATIKADLADISAKLSDAASLSVAAQAKIASLKPDNGDATVQASNAAALKDARAKIEAARKDLQAVRKDSGDIVKMVISSDKSLNAEVKGSASTTTQ